MSETSPTESEILYFPDVKTILLELPLYKEFDLTNVSYNALNELETFKGKIDSFCIECQKQSVFESKTFNYRLSEPNQGILWQATIEQHKYLTRSFHHMLTCARNEKHLLIFYFKIYDKKFVKVGQFPSLADLQSGEIAKYQKPLGEYASEFAKAIGLASHGVGVGSFVYLRRIFENLIEKAHQTALKNETWRSKNETVFNENQKRVIEKILLLKDYLPEFLVTNRTMYGIISKGIHELTEDECLRYFPIIKNGIELILDQEIERRAKIAKEIEAQKQIQQIQNELLIKDSKDKS